MRAVMILTFSSAVEASDSERRIIAGKIVPFGEIGNTSAGPVVFQKGSIKIGDPGKIKMLMQHKADKPIGRMQKFQQQWRLALQPAVYQRRGIVVISTLFQHVDRQ